MKPSHRDLGFTDEAFFELVDFYREIFHLDENLDGRRLRRSQQMLVATLKLRLADLKQEKQNELQKQLDRLERL